MILLTGYLNNSKVNCVMLVANRPNQALFIHECRLNYVGSGFCSRAGMSEIQQNFGNKISISALFYH